jgi:hypothetical protein
MPVFVLRDAANDYSEWLFSQLKIASTSAEDSRQVVTLADYDFDKGVTDFERLVPSYGLRGISFAYTWNALQRFCAECLYATAKHTETEKYNWRERLSALERWRGEPYGKASDSIAPSALSLAGAIAAYAESRIRSIGAVLPTVLAPGQGRGVHMEWTARNSHVSHLEISISAMRPDRFELLRSEETLSGRILSAFEFADATLEEVIAFFEQVLAKAPRA